MKQSIKYSSRKAISVLFGAGALALCSALTCALPAAAGEGGAGLYIPGSQAFGAGVTPPPGLYLTQAFLVYDAKVSTILGGGLVTANARKTAVVSALNVLWVPTFDVAGGRFGISASIPYAANTRLQASAGVAGNTVAAKTVDGWGIGDISFKAQLGWTHGEFSHTVYASMWTPTGRYETGFFPATGKNHYGFDVGWGFTQVWKEAGIELSGVIGITTELANPATKYRNGAVLHLEGALGKKFDNGLMLGVAGYAYQQISDDSGTGATLGPLRGRTYGVGPALSYSFLAGSVPTSLSLRHYQEFSVENRFKGTLTTGSATFKF
jgi:hypothetical protein